MTKKLYKLLDYAKIEEILYSDGDNPHAILGAHKVLGGIVIQCFFPNVKKVYAVVKVGRENKEYQMELADEEGFYACFVNIPITAKSYSYFFRVVKSDGVIKELEDPYSYKPLLKDEDFEKFSAGIDYEIYNKLGAHIVSVDGTKGTRFAVYAPGAMRVSVIGEFNEWDGRVHQMRKLGKSGVFEIFIPDCPEGALYKYEIKGKGNSIYVKTDPYSMRSILDDNDNSVVCKRDYKWNDNDYMVYDRADISNEDRPVSIYQLYIGSFSGNRGTKNIKSLTEDIYSYVSKMGYTHIELLPVNEYRFDESLGLSSMNLYSISSRYGEPADFKYFVDYMHQKNIPVILNMDFTGFSKDDNGLSYFDGSHVYESFDEIKRRSNIGDAYAYDLSKPQVSNYLLGAAIYFIKEYHIDAIKLMNVAAMLYLDYGRNEGEWYRNMYGSNENLDAIEFFKHLTSIVSKLDLNAKIIADDTSLFPDVTTSLDNQGLGFDYKRNAGFSSDLSEYVKLDNFNRSAKYHELLTPSMIYAYSEKFIVGFSYDELLKGKGSLLGNIYEMNTDKFAMLRALYGYMFTHPGKKLIFMGQDLAPGGEWDKKSSINWDILKLKENNDFNNYIKSLLNFYRKHPALYELDNYSDGFEWINNISANENILVFLRKSQNQQETLLVVVNFSNQEFDNYKIGVPFKGKYKEMFNSESIEYDGVDYTNKRVKFSKTEECDGRDNSIRIKVAPFSVSIFDCYE